MIKATVEDKEYIVNILVNAFDSNKSVNYIIRQDRFRLERIKALMEYSVDVCLLSGCVYLSEDRKACALISFPDQKNTSLKTLLLDIQLVMRATGLGNIRKVLKRERVISQNYPDKSMYYLWFIGVDTSYQNLGIGKRLLLEIIEDAGKMNRAVYLETSTEQNIPWYKKAGFEVYNQMDFGYTLYLLKREAGENVPASLHP